MSDPGARDDVCPDRSAGGADNTLPDDVLEFAVALTDVAGVTATRYFRRTFGIEHKADASPVTVADREIEAAMRARIADRFPDHGIFGEEHGTEQLGARYIWVLDPIDGTAGFAIGAPMFGTLVALLEDGKPILGIISCPAMKQRWVGVRGQSTTMNGRPVMTRNCSRLDSAWVSSTSPDMFVAGATAKRAGRLRRETRRTVWGLDCYAYGLLADGTLDMVLESDLKPYDFMAAVPVVEGAGGRMTDWNGQPLTLNSCGRTLACGDPAIHGQAVKCLASA